MAATPLAVPMPLDDFLPNYEEDTAKRFELIEGEVRERLMTGYVRDRMKHGYRVPSLDAMTPNVSVIRTNRLSLAHALGFPSLLPGLSIFFAAVFEGI